MAITESYTQVAPDSSGKKIRNVQVTKRIGDTQDEHQLQQQVVTISGPDGTVLSTADWQETDREKYMRQLFEQLLLAMLRVGDLLTASTMRTSPRGAGESQ